MTVHLFKAKQKQNPSGKNRTGFTFLGRVITITAYLATGPIIASIVPAATAVPITPATLGPIA
ncbi:hypothetical protein, partial [Phascolarctobacterium succinatutens]|uniref:hypothetical protein n=1 Tax=Phascolarctobacterium succinatutens TaxID=626940 RepID=UPI00307A28F4